LERYRLLSWYRFIILEVRFRLSLNEMYWSPSLTALELKRLENGLATMSAIRLSVASLPLASMVNLRPSPETSFSPSCLGESALTLRLDVVVVFYRGCKYLGRRYATIEMHIIEALIVPSTPGATPHIEVASDLEALEHLPRLGVMTKDFG